MPKVIAKSGPKSGNPLKALTKGNDKPAEKKKRNNNPGVRQQGGRIYDSENGTTCHQCRQKTIEIKARCKSAKCTLYFCPRCLENRYSEIVDQVNLLKEWTCPRCRKQCNCSNCRKKQGLEATGILANIAKTAGFGSVSDLLQKNPKAQAFHMQQKAAEAASTAVTGDAKNPTTNVLIDANNNPVVNSNPVKRPATVSHKIRKQQNPIEKQLIEDDLLGPRPSPMPPGKAIAAINKELSLPNGKRQRGPAWLDTVPLLSALPADVDCGKYTCILEFMATFSSSPAMNFRSFSLPGLAVELIQPPATKRSNQLCPVPEDSMVAAVHVKLLEIVRSAWGVKGGASLSGWQALMKAYYAAALLPAKDAAELRDEHGPPAVAGEMFIRPPSLDASDDDRYTNDDTGVIPSPPSFATGNRGTTRSSSSGEKYSKQQGEEESMTNADSTNVRTIKPTMATKTEYPHGGYWALAPSIRVDLLFNLLHDALDTFILRDIIEKAMNESTTDQKERKNELADVRRAAKDAAAKQRNEEIALMIAHGAANAMSLDRQREIMEEAKKRADEAAQTAAAAKLKALSEVVHPPMTRIEPLGVDRDGRHLFYLQCSALLRASSSQNSSSPSSASRALIGVLPDDDVSNLKNTTCAAAAAAVVVMYEDGKAVAAAMDPQGRNEGPLRHALVSLYGVPGNADDDSNKNNKSNKKKVGTALSHSNGAKKRGWGLMNDSQDTTDIGQDEIKGEEEEEGKPGSDTLIKAKKVRKISLFHAPSKGKAGAVAGKNAVIDGPKNKKNGIVAGRGISSLRAR